MSELTKRLRRTTPSDSGYAEQANEAADRIDALEERLREIVAEDENEFGSIADWFRVISKARALLEEK